MIKALYHIIRLPNLLMIAVIQIIVWFRLTDHQQSVLSVADLMLLCLITIVLGAGGYVINDLYDIHNDRINKPEKWIAGNMLTTRQVNLLYMLLNIAGGLLAVPLAFRLQLGPYLLLYLLAIGGLWLYSYTLKCRPYIGNIWVALFCAGVVAVVAVPDIVHSGLRHIKSAYFQYILFAFIATWYREIIKDIEDVDGDTQAGCQTLVVRYGRSTGRRVAIAIGAALVISILWWIWQVESVLTRLLLVGITLAVLNTGIRVWKANEAKQFHYISNWVKWIMLVATLVLLL